MSGLVRLRMHGLLDLHLIVEFVLFPFGIFWSRVLPRPLALWLRESDPEDVVFSAAFCLLVHSIAALVNLFPEAVPVGTSRRRVRF